MTADTRPLEERLVAYRDNLRFIADQTEDVAEKVEAAYGDRADSGPLRDGVRLYRTIANDLTKVLDGELLEPFAVEGEL